MTRCYIAAMRQIQSDRRPFRALPKVWLLSDARNDAGLDAALTRLPRGAGLVFRHYHLPPSARARRFAQLRRLAARRGVVVVRAGTRCRRACGRGAAGVYASPEALAAGRARGLRLATAHTLRELGAARRARADAVLLSPVWPTRSHPGGRVLGPVRFLLLARQSPVPVLALGGVTPARARRLLAVRGAVWGWAAIDGLVRR